MAELAGQLGKMAEHQFQSQPNPSLRADESACITAISTIANFLSRVFVLDKVTDFLLLLGKLVVVGAVGVLSFYFFSGEWREK